MMRRTKSGPSSLVRSGWPEDRQAVLRVTRCTVWCPSGGLCVSRVHPNGVSVMFLSFTASRSSFSGVKILPLKRFKTKEGLVTFLTVV